MAIKLSQGLKQTQNMAMTPQLQQAIKMLTMTHMEMANLIQTEMMENPLLEEMDGEEIVAENDLDESDASNESENESENDNDNDNLELNSSVDIDSEHEVTTADLSEAPILKDNDDFDWESYADSFNNLSSNDGPGLSSQDPEDALNFENIVSTTMNLSEHLEWQLKMESYTDEEWKLIDLILGNLNDDGYLVVKLRDLYPQTKVPENIANEILNKIKTLDPVGCGSYDLYDCLLTQARVGGCSSLLIEKIILNHLDDLKIQNYKKICKDLNVKLEEVEMAAQEIKNFYPRPGLLISPERTEYILPDIYVVNVGGEFVVQLNDDGIPRLKISPQYLSMIKKGVRKSTDPTSAFVREKLKSAEWMMKAVHTRQKTIFRVAEAIVKKQQEFFKKGPLFLKPMILKEIAEEVGLHDSNISRVTTNKYMHTPIGTFELKYFFSRGVGGGNSDGSDDVSNELLKHKIKQIFDHENPAKPLSDAAVVDLLAKENIQLARRTVAKYREILGILGSTQRKLLRK